MVPTQFWGWEEILRSDQNLAPEQKIDFVLTQFLGLEEILRQDQIWLRTLGSDPNFGFGVKFGLGGNFASGPNLAPEQRP